MQTLPNLEVVRAVSTTVRAKPADGGGMPTMEVRFSSFGTWYEIDSFWEGSFMERTEAGAFAKTISESRDQVRVLFNHGYDPQIGNKVLGRIDDLREEADSPVGVVPLFDTSYNRDLVPGLEAGVYGSSMRMRVIKDEWNEAPGISDHNPKGIPERTIKEVRLFEFGPVTFPANPSSTASVRSMTDSYYASLRTSDPERVEDLLRARQTFALRDQTQPPSGTVVGDGAARTTTAEPGAAHSGGLTSAQRRERFIQSQKGR